MSNCQHQKYHFHHTILARTKTTLRIRLPNVSPDYFKNGFELSKAANNCFIPTALPCLPACVCHCPHRTEYSTPKQVSLTCCRNSRPCSQPRIMIASPFRSRYYHTCLRSAAYHTNFPQTGRPSLQASVDDSLLLAKVLPQLQACMVHTHLVWGPHTAPWSDPPDNQNTSCCSLPACQQVWMRTAID